MKLATFEADGRVVAGLVLGDSIVDVELASEGKLGGPLAAMLGNADAMARLRTLAGRGADDLARSARPIAKVALLAPVPRPGKVLCLGLNYRDHAAESGMDLPAEPVVFAKASSSVIGHRAPIRLPAVSSKVDYEVELAFVVGRAAKNVPEERAMQHVAGYTVLNDVSARDYQLEKAGGQWHLGKSFDTFCPIGPWLVTPDEIEDPHSLDLQCTVSGERLQASNTSQMVFTVPQIVAYLSQVLTLEPGDVVATGTPPGVGFAREPVRFLRAGDVVECTVEGVGTLINPVE